MRLLWSPVAELPSRIYVAHDGIESIGPQGIHPLPAQMMQTSGPAQATLVDAVHRGDPAGVLAPALQEWRALNSRIAAHPMVAPHLPPYSG